MSEPLKSEIRKAVAFKLSENNPDFFDIAMISTFIAASEVKVKINPVIFEKIFLSWKIHKTIKIVYHKHYKDEDEERIIDPYIISYYNSAWYLKGHCHLREDCIIFAIHRIKEVEILDTTFDIPSDILKTTIKGSPFKFEEVKNVEVWRSSDIAGYVLERSGAYTQTYEMHEDGSLTLHSKSAPWL